MIIVCFWFISTGKKTNTLFLKKMYMNYEVLERDRQGTIITGRFLADKYPDS